jgi:adenosylhomocysteinase
VPTDAEELVARLKLASMGIEIDALTEDHKKYMTGWEHGT